MAQTEKGIIYPYDYNEVADVPSDFKALAESIDRILSDYSLNTESGNKIVLEMNNTTYKIKAVLKDKDDNVIDTSNEIDLPLENMVTNITYNNQTLTLTHQDGHTTEVSIADLISDLASKEEVEELQSKVNDLESLVETELDTNTVEGTEIDVSDSAEYRGPVMPGGNLEQEQLSGNQLFDVTDTYNVSSEITVDEEGWITATYDNTAGSSAKNLLYYTNKSDLLETNKSYAIFTEIKSVNGTGVLYAISIYSNQSQSSASLAYNFNGLSNNSIKKSIFNTISDFNTATTMLRTLIQFRPGESGSITFRLSVLENTDTAIEQFLYEKYCEGQAAPNPSYEIPIEVVTGDNVVKHFGMNLFDFISNLNTEIAGLTISSDKAGNIIVNGTPTRNWVTIVQKVNITDLLEDGQTYTLWQENIESNGGRPWFYVQVGYGENTASNYYSVTTASNMLKFTVDKSQNNIYQIMVQTGNNLVNYNNVKNRFMLLKGDYTNKEVVYEPYREEEYEVYLPSLNKNILDTRYTKVGSVNAETGEYVYNSNNLMGENYIKVEPNTTYCLSGNTKFSGIRLSEYDENKTHIKRSQSNSPAVVITTTNNTHYVRWSFNYNSQPVDINLAKTLELQLELGNLRTSFIECEPLELCKIGDYEDILFKNEAGDENYNAELEEGAWYKKKAIDKKVLDDLWEWFMPTTNRFHVNITLPDGEYDLVALCDKFINALYWTTHINTDKSFIVHNGNWGNNMCRISFVDKNCASLAEWTQFVSENNLIVYHRLLNPTYEKITNPTLISQLEALRKAKWFKGVNHWWTETENLEPVLKGTYKQSNNLRLQALEQAVVALGGV